MALEARTDPSGEFMLVMADDANEKVRRVLRIDPVERAFRSGSIDDDQYRVARCIERDWLALLPAGGSSLTRAGDGFCSLPAGTGFAARGQIRRDDALDRLKSAKRAIGQGPAWSILQAWAFEGHTFHTIDRAARRANGWALAETQRSLTALLKDGPYEARRWNVTVWAGG